MTYIERLKQLLVFNGKFGTMKISSTKYYFFTFLLLMTIWSLWLASTNEYKKSIVKDRPELVDVTAMGDSQNMPMPISTEESKKAEVQVHERGYWMGTKMESLHAYFPTLANALAAFFKKENASSVIDLGGGLGLYTSALISAGIFTTCYDGHPDTQTMSKGICSVVDLTRPINFMVYDWVMSLEVGEHIKEEYENTFISSIHKLNKNGIVLSWAIKGQGGTGHVNTRDNDYVIKKFVTLNYIFDNNSTNSLREVAEYWFKNTLMVFRKESTKM